MVVSVYLCKILLFDAHKSFKSVFFLSKDNVHGIAGGSGRDHPRERERNRRLAADYY